MAAGGSNIAIYGAIVANFLIAISKLLASFFTGSAAMLAEGIHSLVDTGNGLLLLLGINVPNKNLIKIILLDTEKKSISGVLLLAS